MTVTNPLITILYWLWLSQTIDREYIISFDTFNTGHLQNINNNIMIDYFIYLFLFIFIMFIYDLFNLLFVFI